MATIDLQSLLSRGNDARYQTELLRDVSAAETSMPVLTTAGHPDVGAIVVDNEKLSYTSRTATTFDGCTRGDDQDNGFAPPTAHAGGAVVKQANRPNYETVVANAFSVVQDSLDALAAAQLSTLPDHAAFALKWGSYGNNNSQFKAPQDIAVDTSGNVYVVDETLGVLKKFSSLGAFVYKSSFFGQLVAPECVCDDRQGSVWIGDYHGGGGAGLLLGVDYGGSVSGTFTFAALGIAELSQIAADANGKLWLADTANLQLVRFMPSTATIDQTASFSWGSGSGQLSGFGGMAVDPLTGYLHIADAGNKRVVVYDPGTTTWQASWGVAGTGAGQFNGPADLSFDLRNGWRYVADASNNVVLVFDQTGTYKFSFGGFGSGDGQFSAPEAVDASLGNAVVVVDQNNNRIEKFTIASAAGGTGDVSSNISSSTAGQLAEFTGTSGKIITPYAGSGLVKTTAGVVGAAVAGTDYCPATTGSVLLKASAGGTTVAVSGTDYAPPSGTTSALKGNGSGGFAAANLGDVANVNAAAPSNGDVLAWSSGSSKWVNTSPGSLSSPADTATSYQDKDDFVTGGTSDGNIGELGWNIGGQGSVSYLTSTVKHLGQLQLSTGGTSGNVQKVFLGAYGIDTLKSASVIFQMPATLTSGTWRFGLLDQLTGSPADGIALEFDTNQSDTNFMNVKYISSVATRTSSGLAPVASAWYRVDFTWNSTGNVSVVVNRLDSAGSGTSTAHSSLSTTALLTWGASAKTLNGTAKTFVVDWANIITQSIGRN